MMKECQKNNLQEPQRNRNATANYVNLIMTSTVRLLKSDIMMYELRVKAVQTYGMGIVLAKCVTCVITIRLYNLNTSC